MFKSSVFLPASQIGHGIYQVRLAACAVAVAFALSAQTLEVNGQWLAPRPSRKAGPLPAVNSGGQQEDYIKPSRPTEAEPAEIQKMGVLQLEFGLDAPFDAEEFRNQQTTPLRLRFAATSRLLLAVQLEPVKSQVDRTGRRMTGVGDLELGSQVVVFKHTDKVPAFAFAYYTKLPTASEEKGLGSGRTDHRAVLLVSKKLGGLDMDFNAAYLNVGRKDSGRRADGGLFALSGAHKFGEHFGVSGEIAGQSLEYFLPRGLYPFAAVTYLVNRRLRFDTGVRFGIGAEAPKVAIVAGFTVGIANLYGK